MPANKDLKRLVRSRMRKTGESYTAARARLLAKRTRAATNEANSGSAMDPASLAGMSDDAVCAKTGRTWLEWARALDAVGAAKKPHRDIARFLRRTHELPSWWAQTVTVGYERIRGLRDVGQRRDGGYEVNKSRTVSVSVSALFAACATARRRRAWLTDPGVVVRKATAERALHWTWPDGTRVELLFDAKGPQKSRVVIQHRRLPSRDAAAQVKQFWQARLDALVYVLRDADRLTGPRGSGRGASPRPKSGSRRKSVAPRRR